MTRCVSETELGPDVQPRLLFVRSELDPQGYENQKSKFRQTIKTLTALCRWKKQEGDKAMPKKKGELETRWKKTKDRNSPHVSPSNSEAEDDEDVEMNDENADVNDASNVEDESLENKSDEESDDKEVIIQLRDRGLTFGTDTEDKGNKEDDNNESSDYRG